jgi:hypothetical protein
MHVSVAISYPGLLRISLAGLRRHCLLGAIILMLFHCPAALSQETGNNGSFVRAAQPHLSVTQEELPELRKLADEAKNSFRLLIEPPTSVITTFLRNETSAFRDYALFNYESAIDALLAEAAHSERVAAVENALRRLVLKGDTSAAKAFLAETLKRKESEAARPNREAAAAARHLAALGEHSELLVYWEPLNYERLPALFGAKALPVYRHAAELDPDDAWTWIILAVLTDPESNGTFNQTALKRAELAALAAGDRHALIVAKQELSRVAEFRGQRAEAERMIGDALALARLGMASDPDNPIIRHDLASSLVRLGKLKTGQGNFSESEALLRDDLDSVMGRLRKLKTNQGNFAEAEALFQEAHGLRKDFAAAAPNDERRQRALIASNMEMFFASTAPADEVQQYFNEALRIDGLLTAPLEWKLNPNMDLSDPRYWTVMVVEDVLLRASGLSLIFGLGLLACYRRRLAKWMKAAATAWTDTSVKPLLPDDRSAAGRGMLSFRTLEVSKESPPTGYRSEPIVRAVGAMRDAAWVYTFAGLAFAIIASVLQLYVGDSELSFRGIAFNTWTWAWPVVLVLGLLWGPDRRRVGFAIFGYLAVVLGFCLLKALGSTPSLELFGILIPPFFQPLYMLFFNAWPTLLLLFFLNRPIRAIGPVVLVFMAIVSMGALAAWILTNIPGVLKAANGFLSKLGLRWMARLTFYQLAGMVLFAPLAWLFIGRICRRYQAKRFGDQTLAFDSIWLLQTLWLCGLSTSQKPWGWAGIGALAAYKLITWMGLRPIARAASARKPARLLLLRVFGFRRRTERFFDLLSARWRYAGPIELISAPDLAGHTIDPGEFMDFLSGRLRRRFIIERGDLDRRFAETDDRPDPDGRYRVNEFFCGNDAWQPVVRRLMSKSDLVVMDLRGFTLKNQGCLFEMHSLIDIVPVARIVLLVDQTTDGSLLKETIAEHWRHTGEDSPNVGAGGSLILLDVGQREVAALEWLFAIADEMLMRPQNLPLNAPGAPSPSSSSYHRPDA